MVRPMRPRATTRLCGDQLVIYLKLDAERVVEDVSFVGRGCAICMASASMMTELVKGRSVDDGQALFEVFAVRCCTEDDTDVVLEERAEKLRVLSGVREFPTRVKCATFAVAHHGGRARRRQ